MQDIIIIIIIIKCPNCRFDLVIFLRQSSQYLHSLIPSPYTLIQFHLH